MLILSADTSLPILSVAIVRDGSLLGAVALEGKGSRNEKLLPAIDWLLGESAIERDGVRIGLATMQGLALALGRPVCAMSTHEAVAFGESGHVAVTDDAGRGELYVTVFDDGLEVIPPHLGTAPEGARVVHVPDFLQRDNVAVRCARRALEIERNGEAPRYRDVTPIYVRLAEAEVKLRQKQNG
jgi:tRNA A37 threonylcarbamoyladenosine modification protein TsaB